MKLEELLDVEALMNNIEAGYISVRHHGKGDLRIYNYTHKCQYDWHWSRTTINCRGLIVNTANEIVARPWTKFFTVEQYKDMRNDVHHLYGVKYKEMYSGPNEVTEKMDGCMGILYWVDGRPAIATRGSFTSHQAELATKIFQERYEQIWRETIGLDRNRTYIFECILPAYRIVVDYDGMNDLVFLGCVNNNTGEDERINSSFFTDGMPPVRDEHNQFDQFDDVLKDERENHEGYVVYFQDTGIRVKVKHQEYKEMHRIMTGCTKRTIWNYMRNDYDMREIIAKVPDEMYDWIMQTQRELQQQFDVIVETALFAAEGLMQRPLSRKEQAAEIAKFPNGGLTWAAIDGKMETQKVQDTIWRMIKPEPDTPWDNQENVK